MSPFRFPNVWDRLLRALPRACWFLVLVAGCRGGCAETPVPPARRSALQALLPSDAAVIASADFARVRDGAVWRRLSALAAENRADAKELAALTVETGLDPFHDVHRVVAAFPEDARTTGAFALIFEGDNFDEGRLVAYAQKRAGRPLSSRNYRGRTLWKGAAPTDPTGVFLGKNRFVLGGGGWVERVVDKALNVGPDAAADTAVARLAEAIAGGRPLWLAAVVPLATRKTLLGNPKYDVAASLTNVAVALDVASGIDGELLATFTNPSDARAQLDKLEAWRTSMKESPAALLLGAGPYLDALTARSEGSTLRVRARLSETLVDELFVRLGALRQLSAKRAK